MDSGSSKSFASLKRVVSPAGKPADLGEKFIAMYTEESSEQGNLIFQLGDMIPVTKKDLNGGQEQWETRLESSLLTMWGLKIQEALEVLGKQGV